jgi:uncharacterized protein
MGPAPDDREPQRSGRGDVPSARSGPVADLVPGSAFSGFAVPWSPWAVVPVYVGQFILVGLIGLVLTTMQLAAAGVANVILLPITSLTTAALTVGVVWVGHPGEAWRLRGPRLPKLSDLARGLGFGLAAYALVNVAVGTLLQAAITASGGEIPVIQQTFRDFAADPEAAPVFLVAAIVLAPIGEELLFRGLLYSSLRARWGRRWALLTSAIAFALVHLDPSTTLEGNLIVAVLITALAAILAWVYDRTGSLAVPIATHCVYNAVSAVLLVVLEM